MGRSGCQPRSVFDLVFGGTSDQDAIEGRDLFVDGADQHSVLCSSGLSCAHHVQSDADVCAAVDGDIGERFVSSRPVVKATIGTAGHQDKGFTSSQGHRQHCVRKLATTVAGRPEITLVGTFGIAFHRLDPLAECTNRSLDTMFDVWDVLCKKGEQLVCSCRNKGVEKDDVFDPLGVAVCDEKKPRQAMTCADIDNGEGVSRGILRDEALYSTREVKGLKVFFLGEVTKVTERKSEAVKE